MNVPAQPPVPSKGELITVFKNQVANGENEFRAALPAHIPVERFMRVVTTAVTSNPDLLGADRRSLFEAATKAAQDGLLPDGRDGALVIFGGKVQWMPMIGGILKKIRNSGELISISAYVAYSNDEFIYELGDEEKISHRPALEERGKPRLVYAIAKTKDGGIYREVMTVTEIEKVRAVSRAAKKGPWVDWWDEMARKTVMRRLAKRLPMSSDLDDLIRRDDALYDFDGAREKQDRQPDAPALRGLSSKLDALAASAPTAHVGEAEPPHDPETGEIVEEVINPTTLPPEGSEFLESSTAVVAPIKTEDIDAQTLDEDPTLTALLAAAREKTKEGAARFKFWAKKLDAPDFERLEPHLPALCERAAEADAARA